MRMTLLRFPGIALCCVLYVANAATIEEGRRSGLESFDGFSDNQRHFLETIRYVGAKPAERRRIDKPLQDTMLVSESLRQSKPLPYIDYLDFYNILHTRGMIRDTRWKNSKEVELSRQRRHNISMESRSEASAFAQKVRQKLSRLLRESLGGTVEEIGAEDVRNFGRCVQRPPLRMKDVRRMAQKSFGAPNFKPVIPPCRNGGVVVACAYDGGRCCMRPQVEFIERYYDTAVAAMALGATADEAFAPLIHARALASILEICDANLNVRNISRPNGASFPVQAPEKLRHYRVVPWLSYISFPQSYEVLYELYNTMLIERMRSRRGTVFPRRREMLLLHAGLYYKRNFARLLSLDKDLQPEIDFPSVADFRRAGVSVPQFASGAGEEPARKRAGGGRESAFVRQLEVEGGSRMYTRRSTQLYERRTRTWVAVNSTFCNRPARGTTRSYFPYSTRLHAWDKDQGCCASECYFMALYGRTFSGNARNCCSGCNRFNCRPNEKAIVKILTKAATIKVPAKRNRGVETLAFMV